HTPGIDAAGEVAESTDARFSRHDAVLVTGYDLGMNTSGGFAEYVRVPAAWVVPLPAGLSLKESMMLGTAGFTAALSRLRLEAAGVTPESGEVLVTGATGGLGSLVVALMAGGGYSVTAATGKTDAADYLKNLGAGTILDRQRILDEPDKPLLPGRFSAVIDTVGGDILSYAIRASNYAGVVVCCGNAASPSLNLTVYPFILRDVRLIGVASAECPMTERLAAWERLAGPWRLDHLNNLIEEITLTEVAPRIDPMLAGQHVGRRLIRISE
ncbi:MAG: YhdH/YhfP family quinone oxidoreductase, partial [Desulfatitalea sp.]|nr:YhdH/YhfP family quinone oxidoreductase [Desulfatitalea sp.]NNK01860.1 YhdH/YhfP family quinone oxidoreductase [Desulfatitalea sp.]